MPSHCIRCWAGGVMNCGFCGLNLLLEHSAKITEPTWRLIWRNHKNLLFGSVLCPSCYDTHWATCRKCRWIRMAMK